jgi:hypothetical protein
MLKDKLRDAPIKFEYTTTECMPGAQTLGTEMSMLVMLSDARLVLNKATNFSSSNTETSELLSA